MSQKKTKQYIPKSVKVTSVPVEKERDGTLPIKSFFSQHFHENHEINYQKI